MTMANPNMTAKQDWRLIATHPNYVRLLCAVLRNLNIDLDLVLQHTPLTWEQLVKTTEMIPFDSTYQIIFTALQISQRPWLGLEVGRAMQPFSHGPLGYAMSASANLRQALDAVERYSLLRTEFISFETDAYPNGTLRLTVRERIDLGPIRFPMLDALLAAELNLLQPILGPAVAELRITLPRPKPAWAERYARMFPGELVFGAEELSLTATAAILDIPNVTADPRAYQAACRECETLKTELLQSYQTQTSSMVQAYLRHSQQPIYPTLTQVATHLGMSNRTLMRKLKQEGNTYQQLIDQLRKEKALHYLQHSQLVIEEIATLLGYIDTSNFSRTFRRWFGMPPLEMRERLRAPPSKQD